MTAERSDRLHAAIVAVVLLGLYAATAPRTVMMEDDGTFVLASHFMGVAHPPGYPLYTMLGKLFTLLPFGSVAYRVHLLSAAFGALSCAVLWLCARALLESRLAAYLAAFALGLSPVFWSQAIIAEVYTLNTFFFFTLLWLGLRGGSLAAMAFLFGLSLSNHWPLMLLCAPALAVLLWPRRQEILPRLLLLIPLLVLGLLPYAWMVVLSQEQLVVSFAGPIGSLPEFWFFVSRAGYAEVDVSDSANWLDRLRYLSFFGGQLLLQFALIGTLLAAVGFWAQWRQWGRRISAALALAFLMPSVVLVFLLGFDYDAFHKHVFHVYPLPAYGIGALWLALGFTWLARRQVWGSRTSAALCAGLLALIGAIGLHANQLSGYAWVARYARAVLTALPKDAVVLVKGADVGPLGYLHLVEELRPDVTLYHPNGLVLGNRLFHPYRTDKAAQEAAVRALIDNADGPVATTAAPVEGVAWREHWLFATRDKAAPKIAAAAAEIPPSLAQFYQENLLEIDQSNAYIAFFQGELRRRYAALIAQSLPPGSGARELEMLSGDFFGSLGAVEGLLANRQGYALQQAVSLLETAARRMPADASKAQQARFLELRAYVRLQAGDRRGAIGDLEAAGAAWPVSANGAVAALKRLRP